MQTSVTMAFGLNYIQFPVNIKECLVSDALFADSHIMQQSQNTALHRFNIKAGKLEKLLLQMCGEQET